MADLDITARWALLAETVRAMAQAHSASDVVALAQAAARRIARADGITIVKRIGEETDYLAEDTIVPLWSGLQFPIDKCLAGRAMTEERTIIVPDITHVEDIPLNVYLATFIRSLVAVPIGDHPPSYAICAYWRETRPIDPDALALFEALARGMGAAFALVEIFDLAARNSAKA